MSSGHSSFDSENQNTFSNAAVAHHYVSMTSLFPPEARALDKIRSMVKDRPIMDIGVGSGRTTPYLPELSKDYVAIDYSPEMIARCRTRFPGVKFELGDARRLEGYPTGHFGLLLFSFNGLDYVQHPDRMQILRECHRVVRDDGWFLFSSHNELWHSRASQPLAWRVLGQMRDSLRYLRHLKSLRPVRNPREGFSYRCERVFGNTQTLLVYYLTPDAQFRQLRSVGFACEAMFNTEGDELRPDMHEARPSAWLYYLARKADSGR